MLRFPGRHPYLTAKDSTQTGNPNPGDLNNTTMQTPTSKFRPKQIVIVVVAIGIVVPMDEPYVGQAKDWLKFLVERTTSL